MTEGLRARVRDKLLRQIAEDGNTADEAAFLDDSRLTAISYDLAVLEDVDVADDDPLIEEMATRYRVP